MKTMDGVFFTTVAFNKDVSDWDVANVTTMEGMFNGASKFNNGEVALDWGDKTSKVTSMSYMFFNAPAFNQNICGWEVEKVTIEGRAGFASDVSLENKHNPFHQECINTKSK